MKSGRIIMGVDLTGNVAYDAYYICALIKGSGGIKIISKINLR